MSPEHQRLACFDAAGDALPQSPLRTKRDERRLGLLAIPFLQRCLHRTQIFGLHREVSLGGFPAQPEKRAGAFR
jgi:hypothetical protein